MNHDNTALVIIDVQRGFEDESFWGAAANPDADANIAAAPVQPR